MSAYVLELHNAKSADESEEIRDLGDRCCDDEGEAPVYRH